MRRTGIILTLALTVLSLNSWPASACGDKLLILGQGARFNVAIADKPAWILLYSKPREQGEVFKDVELRSLLERFGHRLRSVRSREELTSALQTQSYDLVLADLVDAPSLEALVQSAPSRPILLPWVYKPTKAEKVRAENQYQLVLNAPVPPLKLISLIDQSMEARERLNRKRANGGVKAVSLLR
jgi:hypothetical protein